MIRYKANNSTTVIDLNRCSRAMPSIQDIAEVFCKKSTPKFQPVYIRAAPR